MPPVNPQMDACKSYSRSLSVAALKGKASPTKVLSAPAGKVSQCKCCSSEEKGILAIGSQGTPESHTAQQTSHKRFTEREKSRRVALFR